MSIHTRLDNSLETVKTQTRAERRRLEREQAKSNKIYNLTLEQLNGYMQRAREEARKEFIEQERNAIDNIVFNSFVIALNKIEGFGKVRINRVLEEAREQVECLKLGYLSMDDMKQLSESLQGKADKIR